MAQTETRPAGESPVAAVNVARRLALLDDDSTVTIELRDCDCEPTDDPGEAVGFIAQLPSGEWVFHLLSDFEFGRPPS